MVVITGIKRGLKLLGRIDNKYNINKIFIDKYAPPGWRPGLYKIVEIAGALGGGYGIYNYVNTLIAPETPGNDVVPPIRPKQRYVPKTGKSYQTRGRYTRCPSSRNRRYRKPNY